MSSCILLSPVHAYCDNFEYYFGGASKWQLLHLCNEQINMWIIPKNFSDAHLDLTI